MALKEEPGFANHPRAEHIAAIGNMSQQRALPDNVRGKCVEAGRIR